MERRKDDRRSNKPERRCVVDESSPLRRSAVYRRMKVRDRRYHPHKPKPYIPPQQGNSWAHDFIIKMNERIKMKARKECEDFIFDLSTALENRY